MGGMLTKGNESPMTSVPTTKLEAKILETIRKRESKGTSMKSFNTIILKFPKIDTGLRKCKAIFEEFGKHVNISILKDTFIFSFVKVNVFFFFFFVTTDEDKSGTIDPKELNHCFRKLEIDFSDEEIKDIFKECDINDDLGINFKEFIVLLCLVYLLKKDSVSVHAVSFY